MIRCTLKNFQGCLLVAADEKRPTIDFLGIEVPRRSKDKDAKSTTKQPEKRGDLVEDPGLYARKVLKVWKSRLFKGAVFETWDTDAQTWRGIDIHTLPTGAVK